MFRLEFKQARLAANHTQRSLALACDLTENCIRQLETGRRNPSGKVMLKVAQILNARPEVLFSDLLI